MKVPKLIRLRRSLTATAVIVFSFVVLALPARADFTSQNICNNQSRVNCLFADGTSGDQVYTKDEHDAWSTEHFFLGGTNAFCTDSSGQLTQFVQYRPNDNYFCPFIDHSMDNLERNKEIVIAGPATGGLVFNGHTNDGSVKQCSGSCFNDYWVKTDIGTDSGFWQLVNVGVTNDENNGHLYVLAAGGIDNPVLLTSSCTLATCEWQQK